MKSKEPPQGMMVLVASHKWAFVEISFHCGGKTQNFMDVADALTWIRTLM